MARIGYVSRGTQGHDRQWLSTLVAAGHEVTSLVPAAAADGPPPEVPQARWTDAADLCAAADRHALQVFVAGPLTDAAVAAVDADVVPTVGISWAFDLMVDALDATHEAALRRTLPHLAALHVDSGPLARLAESLGVPTAKITVAAWGIDTDFFAPGPPRADLLARVGDAAPKVVFSTRSWEPVYDVPTVIRGFARARRSEPALRLVLGGDGSDSARVEAEIARCDVGRYVIRTGRVDAVTIRDWLRCADVYVSAAHSDGSSLSLIEALAVGVPAVVTDLETNREWIASPVLGALFPPGDAEELAAALLRQVSGRADDEAARVRRELAIERGDRAANRHIFLAAVERVIRAAD